METVAALQLEALVLFGELLFLFSLVDLLTDRTLFNSVDTFEGSYFFLCCSAEVILSSQAS